MYSPSDMFIEAKMSPYKPKRGPKRIHPVDEYDPEETYPDLPRSIKKAITDYLHKNADSLNYLSSLYILKHSGALKTLRPDLKPRAQLFIKELMCAMRRERDLYEQYRWCTNLV
jgi:hypothetical protein